MKALFILFLTICTYQITCQEKKIFVKTLPKKVKPYNKLQILNSGRVYKAKTLGTTKHSNKKEYTAFPAIGRIHKDINVPDSLYFVQEQNVDQKPRVKKVLPDYAWTSQRSKRSADVKHADKLDKEHAEDNKPIKHKISKFRRDTYKGKHRDKRVKSKSNRDKHGRLRNRASAIKDRHGKAKNLKYTKESSKRKAKRGRSRLKKERTRKGKLHDRNKIRERKNRKSEKVSKKSLPKDSARRLIAGNDAIIEDYPYVVSIQKSGQHWCAGALLNPRLVITTANCLWKGSSISRLQIRAGSRYISKGGQMAGIQEVMKHPGWGIRRNPDNDVALILLDKNIRFSDSVHGVDLPNRVMMPPFDDAWITSWGAERRDGVYDNKGYTLQVYHTRLLDRAKCNNVTQRFGVTVTDNFICLTQAGRRAPCTRDTGAPAVSDGVLWGMASWGIRKLCGTERFPAVFSYVASQSNMDFILNATRFLMADERHYPFLDKAPRFHFTSTSSTPATLPF